MSDVPTPVDPTPVDPMPDDPWTKLSQRPCRHLACKEMFYDYGVPLEERGGSGAFWCEQTYKCLGPDNLVAGREECGPGRECYER